MCASSIRLENSVNACISELLALRLVCCLCLLLACSYSYAGETEWSIGQEQCAKSSVDPWCEFRITREKHIFSGLASYYNGVSFYIVRKDVLRPLDPGEMFVLENGAWLAVVSRFKVLLVQSPGLSLRLSDRERTFRDLKEQVDPNRIQVVDKSDLHTVAPKFNRLRYAHLWAPLSWLARVVEYSLVAIHAFVVSHWGLAIVVFSILLKLLLFPVHTAVARMQDEVSRVRTLLEPQLAEIKANYEGEEAHNRVMAAHETLGVTPFYSLKPLLGLLIQVPIWIAVFNALGEMSQLAGQSFLWIEDMAYPDVVAALPFNIPLLGATVHLLPFVMFGATCLSARTFRNERWSEIEHTRQRRKLYWMALAFLLLFYPFPAAMVLYWTLNILLQIAVQLFVRSSATEEKAINAG